jgi:DNA-binding transcriptional regulator PaaX
MRKQKRLTTPGHVEEDILLGLSIGEVLWSALISARSTRTFYREAYKRAHAKYVRKRAAEALRAKGLIDLRDDTTILTSKGREIVKILSSRKAVVDKLWRGNWCIIMYDIPVSMSPFRFELRSILVRAGFKKLQHSVWIHASPCKELELFLKNNRRLIPFVRLVQASPFVGMQTLADWNRLAT